MGYRTSSAQGGYVLIRSRGPTAAGGHGGWNVKLPVYRAQGMVGIARHRPGTADISRGRAARVVRGGCIVVLQADRAIGTVVIARNSPGTSVISSGRDNRDATPRHDRGIKVVPLIIAITLLTYQIITLAG